MRWNGTRRGIGVVLVVLAMGMPETLLAQHCLEQDGLQDFGPYNQRASDVAITGNYALTADLRGLTVYDISDVADPQWTAELALPGEGIAITLDGTVAWVALGEGGLSRVDITDPANPQLVDPWRDLIHTQGTALDVAVEGNYAFVANGDAGLAVIDVSGSTPSVRRTCGTSGTAVGIAVSGGIAYVAAQDAGLEIYDVSDPMSPSWLATVPINGSARDVFVAGGMASVAAESGGLQIVDVSIPSAPVLRGSTATGGWAERLTVVGSYAFVADWDAGLTIVDLWDPDNPGVTDSLDTNGLAWGVASSGGVACIADDENGLVVFDISDPTSPFWTGEFPWVAGVASGIASSPGQFACIADGSMGLQTLDISDPSVPTWAGLVDTPGYAVAVALHGTDACVADLDGGLQIVDVSNIWSPSPSGQFATADLAIDVAVTGDTAVVAEGEGGLEFVDISDVASPVQLATFDTPGWAGDVEILGSLALVADWDGGLRIIDLSSGHPVAVGSFETAAPAMAVSCSDHGIAAVVESGGDTELIDISDPWYPSLAGTIEGQGTTVRCWNDEVFIGGHGSLWGGQFFAGVWDIRDPSHPEFITAVDTDGQVTGFDFDPTTDKILLVEPAQFEARNAGCPSCKNLRLQVSPPQIQTGGNTSTIIVSVDGLLLGGVAGQTVEGTTDLGSLSAFTDSGNGDYTATLTSGATAGTAHITIRLNGGVCMMDVLMEIRCAAGQAGTPGNVQATAQGDTSVHVTWDAPAGSHGAAVYREDYRVAQLAQGITEFTDTDLGSDTTYCYSVAALDSCGGEGARTAAVCVHTTGTAENCPAPAGRDDLGGENARFLQRVAFDGSFVYASGTDGVGIWNATDPYHPSLLSHWPTHFSGLPLTLGSGGRLYVVDGIFGLAIVDVSVPAVPITLGRYQNGKWVFMVAAEGTTAYVVTVDPVDWGSALEIIDVSDPESPQLLGSYDLPADAYDLAVSGGIACIGSGDDRLLILDVSDPANPTLLGSHAFASSFFHQLTLSGDRIFLTNQAVLEIIDISDPTAPHTLSMFGLEDYAGMLDIVGDLLYVGEEFGALEIIDVSDSRHPVLRGVLDTGSADIAGVAVVGDTAALTYPDVGLQMVDVSTPSNPAAIGTWTAWEWAMSMAVSGTLAVVGQMGSLKTVDLSDPLHPRYRGSVDLSGYSDDVAAEGDLAYVALDDQGLQIVDLIDPDNPFLAGLLAPTERTVGVAVSGSYAYTLDSSGGNGLLHIVDVSDEFYPTVVRSVTLPESGDHIAVSDGYAFVETGNHFLVVDVSEPTNPFLAAQADMGSTGDMLLDGALVFLGNDGGLEIIDVSDPTAPRGLGALDIPVGIDTLVAVPGTTLYATSVFSFLTIDVSDPTRPILVSQEYLGPWAVDGAMVGPALLMLSPDALTAYSLECRGPAAEFSWRVRGLDVEFQDRSDYGPDTWDWTFGDGEGGSGSGPVHHYPGYGTYTVSLIAGNGEGSTGVAHAVLVGPDVNHDGVVDGLDCVSLVEEIFDLDGTSPTTAAGSTNPGDLLYDLDANGRIGASDIPIVIQHPGP